MNFVVATFLLGAVPESGFDGLTCVDEVVDTQVAILAQNASGQSPEENTYYKLQVVVEYRIFELMLMIIDEGTFLGMEGLWRPGLPQSKLRVYQMSRLMMLHLPKLYIHFGDIGMTSDILVSQWLTTLFTYTVPYPVIIQLWDYVFSAGWPGLFRLSMALLQSCEKSLLAMELEAVRL